MKKSFFIFALSVLAVSTYAATIKWSIGGNTTYVINDVSGNPYASQTIYLVAGSGLSSLIDTTQSKDEFKSLLSDITIATATSSADGTKPAGENAVSNREVSSDLMTAGSSFSFGIVLISEKDGIGYIKTFTTTGTPFADDAPVSARTGKANTAWSAAAINSGSWTASYAVPEPSVALMGLLGIGMLLKRRKA